MFARAVRPLIITLGILAIVITAALAAIHCIPIDLTQRMQSASAPSSQIYDRNGVLLYEILDPNGGSRRTVTLDQVPLALQQAVIATEDASFYSNPGFSPSGLLRAAVQNIRAGQIVSGASTITQQVARQLLMGSERHEQTLSRKAHEIWLAIRLTATLSKDEILTLYLNEMYFGNLSYGVEAAARGYFGKPVRELGLAECAMIAGIAQSPVAYNPLTHPEAASDRQRTVLNLMAKEGYIDQASADRAASEPMRYAGDPYSIRAPHFAMMVRDELVALVGEDALMRGGLVVETTLDWGLQQRAETIVRDHLSELNTPTDETPPHRVSNAAAVVLDASGAVRALVGSPDYWDSSIAGAVNGATALRQPGSALKPFTYAAAFARGLSPASPIADVRTVFRTYDGAPYIPVNYDGKYHGLVSLREALAGSYNVAAVRLLDTIGIQALPDLVRRLGIDTLNQPERQGLALTLGGAEIRLFDLTAAYATLAAAGARVTPYLVESIRDADGTILYAYTASSREQVLDPRVAYLVTDVLADQSARAGVFGQNSALDLPFPAAVKTGTTTMWRDNWTLGYTTAWTVGVWVGNADGSPMDDASGVTGAAPIWNSLMRAAHRQAAAAFTVPDGLVAVEVCALSGFLPGPACTRRRVEWFLEEHAPTDSCDMHTLVTYDARTGKPATAETPVDRRVYRSQTIWPAEVLQWAIDQGLAAAPTEQQHTAGISDMETDSSRGLYLASPEDGSMYRLSTEVPGSSQRLLISAVCELCDPGGRLLLELDGSRWHEWSSPPYTVYWPLEVGEHVLSLAYEPPNGTRVESEPVVIAVTSLLPQGDNER